VKHYLIKNFKLKDKDGKPAVTLVDESEIWAIVQDKPEGVAIYEVGQCIIDWS
jgi:hypothetical protein